MEAQQLRFDTFEPKRREQQPVSDEVIRLQPSKLAAIKLSIQVSGREEKEIYMALNIDKATWSKIMSGLLNFPTNAEEQFMEVVGNEIILRWMNFRRGYRMVPEEDAKEKTIRLLKEENFTLKHENELLKGLFKR